MLFSKMACKEKTMISFLVGVIVGATGLYGWQHRAQVQDAVDRLRDWIHKQ